MTAVATTEVEMPKLITYGRQELILPQAVASRAKLTVFGCGTVGSNVATEAARLGVKSFELYDFDDVEGHNIPSQRFIKSDIGRPKVDALKDRIANVHNAPIIKTFNRKVDGPMMLDGIVLLAVDSMESRKAIYDKAIAKSPRVGLVLDFRMAGNLLQCYAFARDDERYTLSLFGDDQADTSTPCGGRTVSYTGALSGSIGANYIRKHLAGQAVPYMTSIDLESMELLKSTEDSDA